MAFKFPVEIQRKINENREAYDAQVAKYANLNNASLCASVKLYMQNAQAPRGIEPGIPVYDSVLWHVLLPELVRRLERCV